MHLRRAWVLLTLPAAAAEHPFAQASAWPTTRSLRTSAPTIGPPRLSTTVDAPTLGGATPGFLGERRILQERRRDRPVRMCLVAARSHQVTFTDEHCPYALTWNFGVQHVFQQITPSRRAISAPRGVHLFTQDRVNQIDPVTPDRFIPTYLQTPGASTLAGLKYRLGDIER